MSAAAVAPTLSAFADMPALNAVSPTDVTSDFRNVLSSLGSENPSAREMKIHKAAQDYEGMFLGQMLAPMFEGIKTDGMFGGGHAEETWRSFLVSEYGKAMAKRGGFGLAEKVENEMRVKSGLAPKPKQNPKYEVKA